jgi:hypothetical protein
VRATLDGLRDTAWRKRLKEVLYATLREDPQVAVFKGTVGLLVPRHTLESIGGPLHSTLQQLREIWHCELLLAGQVVARRFSHVLLLPVPKTEAKSLRKKQFITKLEIARPDPPPGLPYGDEARRRELHLAPSCIAAVVDRVPVTDGLLAGFAKLDELTSENKPDAVAVTSIVTGYLRASREKDQEPMGAQFVKVRRAYCRVWNLLLSAIRTGDEARPFVPFLSASDALMVTKAGGFVPRTEVARLSVPLFDKVCVSKAEKREGGGPVTACLMRDFLLHLVTSDNLAALLSGLTRDIAARGNTTVADLTEYDRRGEMSEDLSALFREVQSVQHISEMLRTGWSQTLGEWAQTLTEAIKSTCVKRRNGDARANFPGWKSLRRTTTVPFDSKELSKVLAFLGAQDRLVLHGSSFLDKPFTVAELVRDQAICTRFTISCTFRRNYQTVALRLSLPRTTSAVPPQVRVSTGDASVVSTDPGVRVALTSAVTTIVADGGAHPQATITVTELGRDILSADLLLDRRGTRPRGPGKVKVSITRLLHREDRIKSVIAYQQQVRESIHAQEEEELVPQELVEMRDAEQAADEDVQEIGDAFIDAEEQAIIIEQLGEVEEGFREMDRRTGMSRLDLAGVRDNARQRYQRNNDARAAQGKSTRTFAQWLRVDNKRKRRALKQRRLLIANYLKTQKRSWASQLVKAARPGGVIVTPKLNFHAFDRARISRRVRRSLQVLGHCGFVDHELSDACRAGQVLLVVTGEAYTTKTCCACFASNQSVGGSKVFKCPACQYEAPRDGKGAVGIFQRLLAHLPQ